MGSREGMFGGGRRMGMIGFMRDRDRGKRCDRELNWKRNYKRVSNWKEHGLQWDRFRNWIDSQYGFFGSALDYLYQESFGDWYEVESEVAGRQYYDSRRDYEWYRNRES